MSVVFADMNAHPHIRSETSAPAASCRVSTRGGLPLVEALDTRGRLLTAAFEAFYAHGYQGASLSDILARAGVTKGAMYHYFRGKRALLLAVLDEIVAPYMEQLWMDPLRDTDDPLHTLEAHLRGLSGEVTGEVIERGCPLGNLAQEMSDLDEEMRQRMEAIYDRWRQVLAQALRRGQRAGTVHPDLDYTRMALLVVAGLEGCLSQAKNAQSLPLLLECGEALMDMLKRMRP